ncbi:putative pentatricopeptide repeat-containing protein At1g68930 [Glycine max]|nr:putative pentatricopeptide repeat-containing protein At1g68930 [Glycine max]|eukprot:XP_025985626.1 putative pentatricopeptide repeat-containing protein At1g68930 [Glycine max]
MIVGYAQNGREEDAWMLFGDMLCRNVKPDSYTISSMVSSCAKLASLYHGQVVHGKVVVMGIDNNMLIFETMPIQNVITWNAMILGYAQNGQKYFDSISEQQMTPTLDHYACMITLLGRSGRIDKAMDLIQGMPHEPNYHIWSTLLFVCAKGDLKNAELAASLLFELDPHNAGPYIMLSNLYAACGKWKDVAVVRSLMKEKNAKKFAAYSWVEVRKEVHRFVSEDHPHPEVGKIYGEMNRLISILQQIGCNPDTNIVLHIVGKEEKFRSISYQ